MPCIVLVCIGDLNSASCAASVAQLVELQARRQFFFERLLPWDLICIPFLCLSQVSEYLSCMHIHTECYTSAIPSILCERGQSLVAPHRQRPAPDDSSRYIL